MVGLRTGTGELHRRLAHRMERSGMGYKTGEGSEVGWANKWFKISKYDWEMLDQCQSTMTCMLPK